MLKKIASLPLWYVVLLNFILKAGLFCYISPWNKTVEQQRVVVSDAKGFQQIATTLLNNHTFAAPVDTVDLSRLTEYQLTGSLFHYPDVIRTPGYPVYLAAIYGIAGIHPFVAIFCQILLSLIMVVLIYRICLLLFNERSIAIIASFLYAIDFHSAYVANELLSDTIFTLFFTLSIYQFVKGIKSDKLSMFVWSALFMGLSALVKPIGLLYPLVIAAIILFFSKQVLMQKIKVVSVYLVLFGLIVSIWSLRNHIRYDSWQPTAQGGDNTLMYDVAYTKARLTHGNLDSIRVKFQLQADSLGFKTEKNPFERSAIYNKVAFAYIKEHKLAYVLTHLQGGLNLFLSLGNVGMADMFGWSGNKIQEGFADMSINRLQKNLSSNKKVMLLGILILIILAIQYIPTIIGGIMLFKQKNWFLFLFVALTIGYFAAVTGVIGMYRYKLPLVPLICIVGAYGYYLLLNRKKAD